MQRPQPLGILPTWSFWRNRELGRWALAFAPGFAATIFAPNVWVALAIAGINIPVTLGIVERYLRWRLRGQASG